MKPQDEGSTATGILRVSAFLLMTLLMIPVHVAYEWAKPEDAFGVPRRYHTLLLKILGFRLRIHGAPSTQIPVLFVSNHSSYLDIPVLGSLLNAAFIAKSEVAGWPFFGILAKLQNTIFIERRSSRVGDQREHLRKQFAKRRSVILFPEGTSSDGMRVLPFKSALFGIMDGIGDSQAGVSGLTVQPISVACTSFGLFPAMREERARYSWYGDMTLLPHLWRVFKTGGYTVDVVFHQPISSADYADRKKLAAACQQLVARGVDQAITGRGFDTKPLPVLPAPVAAPKPLAIDAPVFRG